METRQGVKRKDYARNLRAKIQKGCVWCGTEVPAPVSTASYCSDLCVMLDHQGIDDIPPAVPCRDVRSMSEEEKSRCIERMNASYQEWSEGRRS